MLQILELWIKHHFKFDFHIFLQIMIQGEGLKLHYDFQHT